MDRRAIGAGLAAAAALAAVIAALLGGEPSAPSPSVPPPPPPQTAPPRPAPDAGPPPPLAPPSPAAPADEAPADEAPVEELAGEALRARVRAIVAQGEGAADGAAELAAAKALQEVLEGVAGRGDQGVAEALALLAPGEAPGVQEVGARLLGRIGGRRAIERLGDLGLDASAPPSVRLLALRALARLDGAYAQGVVADVVHTAGDLGVRAFAMDQVEPSAASALEDVARDEADDPQARFYALQVLYRVDRRRAERVHKAVAGDPALGQLLGELETR